MTPASISAPPAPSRADTTVAAQASAVVDSGPSPEALKVLATIPEPLSTAPSFTLRAGGPAGAPAESASADTGADIPVPAPTMPLGDRPGAAPVILPAGPSPPLAPAALPDSAAQDTCWRVQVAATALDAKARGLAEAASSQLLLQAQVERDGALFKVRLKDCFAKAVADSVCRRARASGFAGAFRFAEAPKP